MSALDTATIVTLDSTLADVNNGPFTGLGFQSAATAGQLDSDSWAATGWDNGDLAFGGTRTTASTDYRRGSTSVAVSTGGFYAYTVGAGNVGLGIQPGGSDWAPGTITLKLQNNTGSSITDLAIAYKLYVRNDQNRGNSFNFSWSTDNSTYNNVTDLDLTSTAASDALGLVLNNKSTSIVGLSVANAGFFYLRWSGNDVNGSGSRDEFVLDDISVTPSFVAPVPEPITWAMLSFGTLFGGLQLRRYLRSRSG